ncbi:MAG: D-cysteine desulfhydrase family protein [Anaerovoracaceae bacterium]
MSLGYNKVVLLDNPTPITQLENISKELGVNIYLKRDDLTQFGVGGNKLRKLEYLVKEAIDTGSTMLITVGGAQTNHGRLTAAVAAKFGMKSAIIAVDDYPGEISANLLLDGIMGCHVYLVQKDGINDKETLESNAVKKVTEEWEAKGEKVYFIPMGGSNELGILGYYDCAVELANQVDELGLTNVKVVVPVGSMGTYMGVAVGIKDLKLPISAIGIGILPRKQSLMSFALEYYHKIKEYFDLDFDMNEEDFNLTEEYDRGVYNGPNKEVREAIYYLGRKEAIIMDPCYTGKAFAGLLEMIKKGDIKQGDNVIMIHTGGVPGIYTKHHRIEMEKELSHLIKIL